MTELSATAAGVPLCDVVVVNYNAGKFLARCIESVLASTLPLHLVVVDNASSDNSLDLVRDLSPGRHRFEIVENGANLGFSRAVNIGAARGTAARLLLLNPDCEIFPHTVANLIAEAEGCERFGILGALVFNEDGTEQRGCRRLEPTFMRSVVTALRLGRYFQSVNLQHEPLPDRVQSLDAVSGSTMMIDREVFEQVGGMDEGYFLHVEDLDICRRVREHGKQVYFTPNVSVFHHHGASSHGVPYRTEWYKHQGMLRYQEKFQRPHQSAIRSLLTRSVIYMNLVLSILRQQLARLGKSGQPVSNRLVDPRRPVVVTGASSDLGAAVLQTLETDAPILALSRGKRFPERKGKERWLTWSYLEKVPADDFPGVKTWLSLSPIWAAPELALTLERFGAIERVVALSSTSIMGKSGTSDPGERQVVRRLIDGEGGLLAWAEKTGADTTICRASMIYGGDNNQNIAFVKRFIRWFRFFPMLGEGAGLRQPVHVEDLADALNKLQSRSSLPQTSYVLAGEEQLAYRSMIEHVFHSEGRKVRFWVIPEGLFKAAVFLVSWVPGLRFLTPEMITRMEQNLVYDIEPARRDFGYTPGIFRPE